MSTLIATISTLCDVCPQVLHGGGGSEPKVRVPTVVGMDDHHDSTSPRHGGDLRPLKASKSGRNHSQY